MTFKHEVLASDATPEQVNREKSGKLSALVVQLMGARPVPGGQPSGSYFYNDGVPKARFEIIAVPGEDQTPLELQLAAASVGKFIIPQSGHGRGHDERLHFPRLTSLHIASFRLATLGAGVGYAHFLNGLHEEAVLVGSTLDAFLSTQVPMHLQSARVLYQHIAATDQKQSTLAFLKTAPEFSLKY